MKSAVIVFPGSNCDRDLAVALRNVSGNAPTMVWHRETELPDGVDLIAVPGGFSCSPNGVTVNVRVIVITGRDVDGKPVTKAEDQMGLLTAYCVGYDPECPDWINNSDFGVLGGTDDPSGGWA